MLKQRYFRVNDLTTEGDRQGLLPVSKNTIWRWVREGKFPAPIKLGQRTTVWDSLAVELFIEKQGVAK
jgi:prophage regulatory protein